MDQARKDDDGLRAERSLKVTLCGYYGFGNLGDELLAEALLDSLERYGVPRSEVAMLSSDPEGSARLHGVRAVSRWSPVEVYRVLKRSETLLLGGGGLFQDATSMRSPLYYWGVVRIALMAGARPWCAGQSVGPFESSLSERLARSALGSCSVRGVRDAGSAELLREWGLDSRLTCDPAFSLAVPSTTGRGEFLLVNIRPWEGDLPRRTAVSACDYALSARAAVVGLALAREDLSVMEGLREEGVFPAERIVLLDAGDWRDECRTLMGAAVGVIAMRLHASVLALLFDRPLTVVPYDPKVAGLAEAWKIPAWSGAGRLPPPGMPVKGRADERLEFQRVFGELCSRALLDDQGE